MRRPRSTPQLDAAPAENPELHRLAAAVILASAVVLAILAVIFFFFLGGRP